MIVISRRKFNRKEYFGGFNPNITPTWVPLEWAVVYSTRRAAQKVRRYLLDKYSYSVATESV